MLQSTFYGGPCCVYLGDISFCSSGAVSSFSYSCYGCCQLLLSLLGVFLLLVLVHLRFFHSVSCGWLPFWGPLLADLLRVAGRTGSAPLPPLVLVVVGTSEGGGGGGLLPGLRVSGGGSRLLSRPFLAVVCPSIGRPGGAGVRRLGL